MKKIKLQDEIYGGNLTVIVGTWAEFHEEHRKAFRGNASPLPYDVDSMEAKHMGGYHCNLFGMADGKEPFAVNLIWVNGKLDKTNQITCLAHELLHAALLLMEMIGVDSTKNGNQETITYWHSWAMRKSLPIIL